MNYRHQFHAGNFADVFKHALLLDIFRHLQRKERGILYLDTHAGRGLYDLTRASRGDTLERKPEHPEGWGRVSAALGLEGALADYVAEVRGHQADRGGSLIYPGSPLLIKRCAREQDRLHLCERHPEEARSLKRLLGRARRVSVHETDGYGSVAAALPPPEKRALVLIDPPYEATNEFEAVEASLAEALRRLPAACCVVWYPLSRRAGAGEFLQRLGDAKLAPTLVAELSICGPEVGPAMWGSGLAILNPPFGIDREWASWLPKLGALLSQGPGAATSLRWSVPE